MKKDTTRQARDEILAAAKREQQARDRAQVNSGARTQESMLLIVPSIVRASTFRRRTNQF
jgi:hypothetical protein